MSIKHQNRDVVLGVLKNSEKYSDADIVKALHEFNYCAGPGDESVILPLLTHPDDSVVATVMYRLWHTCGLRSEMLPLIRTKSLGDDRDTMEMPIQSLAISLLSEAAKDDVVAFNELLAIAENEETSDFPRKRAWQCLAEHCGVEWLSAYSDEMIMSPTSFESERIRDEVRLAVSSRRS